MQFVRGAVKSNQKLDCKINRAIFPIMLFYKSGTVADLEFHTCYNSAVVESSI